MTISRLSPYNIPDDIHRAALYREVREGQTANNDWVQHEVSPDEILRPELIAYRRYGITDLKWLIMIATGLDDQRERLEAGTTIKLPPIVWVRERIKFYVEEMA